MKFQQFSEWILKETDKHKDGTYVALQMSDSSKKELDKFITNNLHLDESIDPNTFHTTVIYSKTPVPSAEAHKGSLKTPYKAKAIQYEVFNTKNDGKCLVLRVDCPEASKLNQSLTKLGATSDYDSYKPHVTICYDYKGDEVSKLPLPKFDLSYDHVEVTPLDTDYVPPNKEK